MTRQTSLDPTDRSVARADTLVQLPPPRRAHARPETPVLCAWDASVQRILCFRPDNMGDVLMTTPALHALKHAYPGRHLTLLASRSGAAVADFIPDIDEVIQFDPPWVRNDGAARPQDTMALVERLHSGHFDAAVIFTVYSQNPLPAAMVCHLAGIPRRLAFCRENPYGLLSDWVPEHEPDRILRHEAQRQLDLVAAIGAVVHSDGERSVSTQPNVFAAAARAGEGTDDHGFDGDGDGPRADASARRDSDGLIFEIDPTSRALLRDALAARQLPETEDYLVFHPGATAASRRWPSARFSETIVALADATGLRCYVTGGPEEAALCASVVAAARQDLDRRARVNGAVANVPCIVDLAGALSLGALAALIDGATLLVTNNSGPLHLASARKTPVVALYALTNPQHGPWRTPCRVLTHDVRCRWCYKSVCPERHHLCLEGVESADVVDQALQLLFETSGIGPASTGIGATHDRLAFDDSEFHPRDAFPGNSVSVSTASDGVAEASTVFALPTRRAADASSESAHTGSIGDLIGDRDRPSDIHATEPGSAPSLFPLLGDETPPIAALPAESLPADRLRVEGITRNPAHAGEPRHVATPATIGITGPATGGAPTLTLTSTD